MNVRKSDDFIADVERQFGSQLVTITFALA